MSRSMNFDVTANDTAAREFRAIADAAERLETKLKDLDRLKVEPKVDLNITPATLKANQLKTRLDALRNVRVTVEVDGAAEARREVTALVVEMRKIRDVRAKVELQTGSARADLTAIAQAMRALRDTNVQVDVRTGTSESRITTLHGKMMALKALSPVKIEIDIVDRATPKLSAIQALARALATERPNIQVTADTAAASAQITALLAQVRALGAGSTTVRIQLDTLTFLGQLARVQTELNTIAGGTVHIDADTRQLMEALAIARVELAQLEAMETSPVVDADTALARFRIEELERELARIAGRQYEAKVDVDTGGAQAKLAALSGAMILASSTMGAGAAAALSLAGALAAAAGAAGLVPAALAGLGGVVATLKMGVGGVSDAFTALAQDQEASGAAGAAAAATQVAAAKQVQAAVRGVEDAQRQADRTAADGARSVADARRAVSDAIASSADRIASAEAQVERAQESRLAAQEALTRAVRDAREAQEDLALSLSGAALSEEAALLSVERARERLANMPADSTALDYKEAELAVRRAEQAVAETAERHIDLQQEAAHSASVGIEGADGVVAAQGRLTAANRGVADADAALAKARADGARDVERANEQLQRAQESAARANEDAARQVQRAQEALADAYDTAGNSGVAAASKSAAALAKLAPSAREFVEAVKALGPAWDGVKMDVQQRLFEGLGATMTRLSAAQLPGVRDGLVRIAGGFNDGARAVGGLLTSATGIDDVRSILDSTGRSTEIFGRAMSPITGMFLDISAVGAPILEELAAGFLGSTTRASQFIDKARETGELEQWIRGGLDALSQIGQVASNSGSILMSTFAAAKASGADLLGVLVEGTAALEAYLRSAQGQTALIDFFRESRAVVDELRPGIADLGIATGQTLSEFSNTGGAASFATAVSDILSGITPLLPQLGVLAGETLVNLASGMSAASLVIGPVAEGLRLLLEFAGPVAPAIAAMMAAFYGGTLARTVVLGLSTAMSTAALNAGIYAERMLNSAAAGSAVAGAGAAAAGVVGAIGRALPIAALAAVGFGMALDGMKVSTDDAVTALGQGGVAADLMNQRLAEQTGQAARGRSAFDDWATGINDWVNTNVFGIASVEDATQAYEAQRAGMTALQRAQQDVTVAQGEYQQALDTFGQTSPQARAAADDLAAATDRVEVEQRAAADATQTHTDRMVEQADQALAAIDADRGYEGALLNLERAQLRAADATAQHGADSLEAREANFALEGQLFATAEAAGERARADAEASGAANADEIAVRAQKDELIRLANQSSGPTRDALLAAADAMDVQAGAASRAEILARQHKDELGRLAGQANGQTAQAMRDLAGNFDSLGGASASAEEKARLQEKALRDMAATASGPVRDELNRMADQIRNLPSGSFSVTANGQLGPMFNPDGTFKGSAGRLATGGVWAGPGKVIRAATGTVLPGYTPGRDVHSFASPTGGRLELSGGEAVMRPEWTRAVGPAFVAAANRAARHGGVAGVQNFMERTAPRKSGDEGRGGDGSRFASGGIIPTTRYTGPVQRLAFGGIVRTPPPYGSMVSQDHRSMAEEAARRMSPMVAAAIKRYEDAAIAASQASAGGSGPTTAGASAGLAWARTQVGKPYVWGGVGPGGYDCSGFMSAIVNVMRGRNPHSRVGATSSFPWPGFVSGIGPGLNIGSFKGNPGHMAGTIGGVNVESSGSVGVRVGGGARGAGDSMFNTRAHLADRGGVIQSGTAALNLSGRAERMLSPRQTEVFERLVAAITRNRGNFAAPPGPLPVATPVGADNPLAAQMRAAMLQPRPAGGAAPRIDLGGLARQLSALRSDLLARPQQVINQTVEGGSDPAEVGRTAVLALRLARR